MHAAITVPERVSLVERLEQQTCIRSSLSFSAASVMPSGAAVRIGYEIGGHARRPNTVRVSSRRPGVPAPGRRRILCAGQANPVNGRKEE